MCDSQKLIKVEWYVGIVRCKAEYKKEYSHFGGTPCYAVYKQVEKKFVGTKSNEYVWELIQNVDYDQFISKLDQMPADAKYTR